MVLVSGPIGDHGMAVMIARGELELEVELESDTAPLNGLVHTLLSDVVGVRCLRDPTRGGLATVLAELALTAEVGITIDESELPIRPEVNGACEILGIDPIYVANEGKLIAIVAPRLSQRRARRPPLPSAGPRGGDHRGGHRGAPGPGRPGDLLRRLASGRHARRRPAAADLLSRQNSALLLLAQSGIETNGFLISRALVRHVVTASEDLACWEQ